MAEYLVLLFEDEAPYVTGGEQVANEVMAAHNEFAEKWRPHLKSGNALQPAATATTIRGGGTSEPLVTDGPFVETKEALGGYYLIEAADLDEALQIAKDVPARFGAVEVRPIMTFE
jgi:hypothetical protein